MVADDGGRGVGVGGVRGVGRSQVGRRWAVADDGLDRARMIAFNGDEVGWVDVGGRVVRHRVWRRRAVADDGVDAATSPTSRPPLGLFLRAAHVVASCVVHRLRVDAVDGELE